MPPFGAGIAGSEALVCEPQEHAKAVTAAYKYPRKIEFIDALPKTVSGKIRRVEVRLALRPRRFSAAISRT